MKFCILMGSPRLNNNTAEICKPFIETLKENGAETEYITLADKTILPCKGCYACQNVANRYGCAQEDDAIGIVEQIISSDVVVLATPIYTWYCTAPMKALLDRHFGLNKFYGTASGNLWEGKKMALITTHGYDEEYGAGPFRDGIIRLCEHSKLDYMGMYSVQDLDDLASFRTPEAIDGAKAFAEKLMAECVG
ncbi:MAG: flavodoxin family protein [Eubacteriales bacterium]